MLFTTALLALLSHPALRQRMGAEVQGPARTRFQQAQVAEQLSTMFADEPGIDYPIKLGGVAVRSFPTDEEAREQVQQQKERSKKFFVATGQTNKEVTQDKYGQFIGPPRKLTLPFSVNSHADNATGHINHGGLLRRARLISDSSVKQHRFPVSAEIVAEDTEYADSPVSSISGDSSLSARREWISALDTAIMAAVRPQAIELKQRDVLAHTLIEDIAQQVTLTFPAVARNAEREDHVNQREDITATASGAGIAGLGNLMSAALRYATNIAMTHMVSPTIYGTFGEVYTAATLLGWVAHSGSSGILTYLLPGYRVKGERDLAGGLVSFATWITLILGFLIAVLFFASAPIIGQVFYHDPSYMLPLQEVALLIPLLALQHFFCSGLQVFKKVKWRVSLDQVGLPLITLIALVIFYLLGWRMEALSFSAIAGFLCSMLIAQSIFRKSVKRFTGATPARYTLGPWIGFAVPLLFNGLIFNIVNTTDILFLSIFVTPAQAGIYIAANRVSNFVSMPLGALSVISLTLMTEYYAKGKYEQLGSICKLITKWSLSLSLPVCLCCLVFHDAILGTFGPQYTAGWLVLAVLCLGNLVNAGTGSVPTAIDDKAIARHLDRRYPHHHFEFRTVFHSGTPLQYSWCRTGGCTNRCDHQCPLYHPGILDYEAASVSLGYVQAISGWWTGLACGAFTAALRASSNWSRTFCGS